ncbi:hypothetical protein FQN57_004792 [Myotisia sp. PD_48]|nr:hypothetical protein FQN57_004792 [Myotisia sp. PD_48]
MAGIANTESADAPTYHQDYSSHKRGQHSFDNPPHSSQENLNHYSAKPRQSQDSTTHPRVSQRHHASHGINGTTLSRTSSVSGSKHGPANDATYLVPSHSDVLGRKESNISRGHSETDSILELYSRDSANRSASSILDASDRKGGKLYNGTDSDDPDRSNWIHRDKLARIESEELQKFGLQIGPASFAGSRSVSRRDRGHSPGPHGHVTANGTIEHLEQRQPGLEANKPRTTSPPTVEDYPAETDGSGELVIVDPRLPEEIAANPYEYDGESTHIYRLPDLRKSSSRIPILLTSHHPIAQEHLERETPLPRTRNNTVGSGDEDGIVYTKIRRTSQSSPRALDSSEPEPNSEAATPEPNGPPEHDATSLPHSSPQKGKTPAKTTPTGRKTSNPQKNRRPSGTSKVKSPNSSNSSTPGQRPVTRSSENRPQTAVNRPEGDPPWLASMYKPDPRLPPDQQVIPTHAKRIQHEQWEREGKFPTTYSRDFTALVAHDVTTKPKPLVLEPPKPQEDLMIKPPSPTKTPDLSNRPGTSGTDGGYKTVPVIAPKPATPKPTSNLKPPIKHIAVEDPPVKEKGCGCCIVM